jgi:membrane fusion protein (multidrug efflux system)
MIPNLTDTGAKMNATAEQTAAPTVPAKKPSRAKMLALLGIAAALAAAGWGTYYYTVGRFHEETDDAYVNGNLVQLTPQVSGTVIAVNADDTQIVKAGEPVVRLDGADAKVALASTEALLGQTVRQISALYVNNDVLDASIRQRQVELARARDDMRRRTSVQEAGAVAAEDVAHARDAVKTAEAALETARQQLVANRTLTEQTDVAGHPSVQAAAAKVRDAYLAYARNTLPAPVDGYVARRSVQVGQRIEPGKPLMAIVPLDGVWVDANLKEVQLKNVRIGQPVEMHADVYGGSVTYHGKVVGFSAGTGSAFSALPAQNATGNWIKVVQRVPVRIQLDAEELRAHPLQIGLSMQVDVHTAQATDSKANLTAAEPYRMSYSTDVFDKYGNEADAGIARIIAQNSQAQSARQAVARGEGQAQGQGQQGQQGQSQAQGQGQGQARGKSLKQGPDA